MEPRSYLANADDEPPISPSDPSIGYPRSGTPGVNAPTTPGPFWYYKIGEELRAVIVAAGLTPADTSIEQLLEALGKLYSADDHNHTPAEVGAVSIGDFNAHHHNQQYAPKAHSHTPADVGAVSIGDFNAHNHNNLYAPKAHSHTPANVGAVSIGDFNAHNHNNLYAPIAHSHTPADVGAVSQTELRGSIAAWPVANPPDGWLECNGATISRTSYADLFSVIGTTFGAGNGSTTFRIPDLRGEFIRGWDHGRGADPGRTLGSSQGDAIRNISGHARFGDNINNTGALVHGTSGAFYGDGNNGVWHQDYNPISGNRNNAQRLLFNASRVVPTANQNRPRNVTMMFCIRY